MTEMRNAHKILVGNPEGKRPLGRPESRWEDNIKIHLREIGWEGVDLINLAQDRNPMMVSVSTSETSLNFYQTTRRNVPADSHLHTRLENLKSHRALYLFSNRDLLDCDAL
jgi:hypothetical protein